MLEEGTFVSCLVKPNVLKNENVRIREIPWNDPAPTQLVATWEFMSHTHTHTVANSLYLDTICFIGCCEVVTNALGSFNEFIF